MAIPPPLDVDFHVATSHDVRSWSFGAVTKPRRANASFDLHVPDTLHDQRIFGTVRDFQCVCGKYRGEKHKGMICDRCGVKVAPATVRGSRFGHIELKLPIPHPYSTDSSLEAFPVLPAQYLQSQSGSHLCGLYDELIVAVQKQSDDGIRSGVNRIVEYLQPLAITSHQWSLSDSQTLARGLALEFEAGTESPVPYCLHCGYLLAGLPVMPFMKCPGCGNAIS